MKLEQREIERLAALFNMTVEEFTRPVVVQDGRIVRERKESK